MRNSSVRLLRNFLTALVCVTGIPAAAQGISRSADPAAWLQGYMEDLKSFQANFRQRSSTAGGERMQESVGTLFLQKPGRFRWEYRQPSEQLIVCDGAKVWLYDAELEQATVKTLDSSLATTPALLLAGKANVTDSFTVADLGTRDGIDWVLLTPKRSDTDFVAIRLGFAAGQLKGMELKDKLAQTTLIDFSEMQRNPPLADALFTFVPPPGVDVIGTPRT